jgi:DNA-binding NtrC family response regulator
LALLEAYAWPGNVRELRNVIERAALLAKGMTIRAADLGSLARRAVRSAAWRSDDLPSLNLIDLEKMAIERALVRTEWHQGQAAEILGVSARTLHRKIREYALKRPE